MESNKGGLKGFWKRRGYNRVGGGGASRRRRLAIAVLGGGKEGDPSRSSCRRRRFWRIKISPRLVLLRLRRAASPRRILARIRDAYVQMMFALSRAVPAGVSYGGDAWGMGFAVPMVKEYDEKVLVEIYKSLIASSAPTAATALAIHR
ncbi:uncharacterized protein LOC122050534 [Zingiber officinale]|uniref:Uncharacterized protein n=1 Tax=Zingiber officinale TaxID=94328 RepID=A0A8J5HWU6_ZINOF|nr:uncharacterized protein LOC122050534 [Zingiber officinale]KAG6521496.1 hypothetical protein ZIOFF_018617 [Zingiber officinale]